MNYYFQKCLLLTLLLGFISLEVSAQVRARVYKDDCYSGSGQYLYTGSYKKSQLSVGNDKISSVKMYSNRHFVRLYEHDNYGGEYRDVYYHMNDLHSIDFEDETSSIKVYSSNTTLPSSNEEVISAKVLNANAINSVSSKTFYIHKSQVDYHSRIHMQALGVNGAGTRIVLTGCVASSPTSGCTGESYIFLFNNSGTLLDVYKPTRPTYPYNGESHPSSIQMIGNVFPVAVATEPGDTGPSSIRFYTIDNDNISIVSGSQYIYVSDHIGTLAYANINGYTYLIGGNWDSKGLHIWRAYGSGKTSNFSRISGVNGAINPLYRMNSRASLDESWSKYNSFWLGKMAEDGRVVLFATHGPIGVRSWADIWEINNINSYYSIRFNKIHKRWKDRATTNRPYFLEGTYPKHRPGNTPQILAFPDDFKEIGFSFPYLYSTLFTLQYSQKYCSNEPLRTDGSDNEAPEKAVFTPKQSISTTPINSEIQLDIYPNPTKANILVDIQGVTQTSPLFLQIIDMKGSLVKEIKVNNIKDFNTTNIDISALNKGIYILKVFNNKGMIATERFVKA